MVRCWKAAIDADEVNKSKTERKGQCPGSCCSYGTSGSFHPADPLEDVSNVPSLASEAPSQQNVS